MDFDVLCNCGGKVNVNDWQLNRSSLFFREEVKNALLPQTDCPLAYVEIELFSCVMPGAVAVMHLKHLTDCME